MPGCAASPERAAEQAMRERRGRPAPAASVAPLRGKARQRLRGDAQSACLRRNAGISKSSMPPEDSASTLAAAWVRLVRHTLGTAMLP